MALPLPWVERIFDKLALAYGRDFIGRWDGLPLASVKTDWGHELAGFENHPEAIKHALQHLPASKAPTVYEFRNLAASAPKMAAIELPPPPQDPEIVKAIVNGLKASAPSNPHGMKEWAYRLRAKEDAGFKLSRYQASCVDTAIGARI